MERKQLAEKIRHYLSSSFKGFFFISFDCKEDIVAIIRESSQCGKITLSRYCQTDKTPDFDKFLKDLQESSGSVVLLGLGEYLALTEDKYPLRKLWGLHIKGINKKVIAPVWNGYHILREFKKDLPYKSYDEDILALTQTYRYWKYKKLPEMHMAWAKGFKALLEELEQGCDREISVCTGVKLANMWGADLSTPFELYRDRHPSSRVPEEMFTSEQWNELNNADEKSGNSFFSARNLLNLFEKGSDNLYLDYVLENTHSHAEFKKNFHELFLKLCPNEERFNKFASNRKELLNDLETGDIKEFLDILRNKAPAQKLPYLSDATDMEKFEIIRTLHDNPDIPIADAYPDLALYLGDFIFAHTDETPFFKMLGDYFNAYKKAKIQNIIPPGFLEIVKDNAVNKTFLTLPTRGSVLENMDNGKNLLFWLDSLGCEYLAFLTALACELGLKIRIFIARAQLPTITSINRGFYDVWKGPREDSKELDRIKHAKDCFWPPHESKNFPLHLVCELNVIRKVMEKLAALLKEGKYPKILLASDHGATRLAVLSENEIQWEMPEPGRQSGRCCKISDAGAFKPSCAVEDENGQWHILADYSTFKGGKHGMVELHGGASLEEVVVPVIELALTGETPQISLASPMDIRPKFKDKSISLTINSTYPLDNPVLHFGNMKYGMRPGSRHAEYIVEIPLDKTESENEGIVYDGDTPLAPRVKFNVHRGIRMRDFDDF